MFWAKMLDFLVNVSLTSLGIIFHLVVIMFVGVVCDTILDTFTVSKCIDN